MTILARAKARRQAGATMHDVEGLYCSGEHDMVIRVAGTMVGLLFIVLFFRDTTHPNWDFLFFGLAFVAYGLGGQRLLASLAPRLAEKPGKDADGC
jgi:hypothetical protein